MESNEFIDNQGLVHSLASKVLRRAKLAGVDLDYEDIVQEMCVTWQVCLNKFDPLSGNKFSTYFCNSAMNNINRFFEKQESYRKKVISLNYDVDIVVDEDANLDDEPISYHYDNLPDATPFDDAIDEMSPDIVVASIEAIDNQYDGLTDEAKMVVQAMANPSKLIIQNAKARDYMAERTRAEAGEGRRSKGITVSFICELFGFCKSTRNKIAAELRSVFHEY